MLGLVVGQGFLLAVLGAAIGIGGAFALTRLLATWLFGVSPTDPATFTAAVVVMMVVSILACFLPARKATQVDPMVALRAQ